MAVHAGDPDAATGAVAPPLHLATTFTRDTDLALVSDFQYGREGGPNHRQLEAALARLDGGEAGLVFASGMAAGLALLQSLESGDRILLPDDAYYGFRVAARDFLARWGIVSEILDMSDLDVLARALEKPARVVCLETPSNPLLKVVDLRGAIGLAKKAGAVTIVDNTFATPALQRPLELGADITLQSSTKYLGGHSDVMGGALVFRDRGPLFEKVKHARHILGAVANPFASWLVLRGLRTLALRMERHSANALTVAAKLSEHPKVSAVHYPGLPGHPGHRDRGGPDERVRRHALVPCPRRPRRRHRRRRRCQAVRPRDVLGMRREPDRAPRHERGEERHRPARPHPPVDRPRASRRPARRSTPSVGVGDTPLFLSSLPVLGPGHFSFFRQSGIRRPL